MTTAERFEDRLLAQLRDVVAANPVSIAVAPPPRRIHLTRLRLAAAGATAAAAAIVALGVSSGGSGTATAYAVTRQTDGMVSVDIRRLSDAEGLERALRAKGVPAEVDYDGASTCATGAPPPAGAAGGGRFHTEQGVEGPGPSLSQSGARPAGGAARHQTRGGIRVRPDGSATFMIDPGDLAPGEKVWITTSGTDAGPSGVAIGFGINRPVQMPCP